MRLIIKLVICFIFSIILGGHALSQNVRSVWMYKFHNWMDESNFGNRLSTLKALQFNQIYLGVLSDRLDETEPTGYQSYMNTFVTQANSLGIEVHALTLQDPHFSITYNNKHEAALTRIGEILQYNIANPDAAFSGIHIDPEPHILLCANDESHVCPPPDWNTFHDLWTTPDEEIALADVTVNGILENLDEAMEIAIKDRRADIMTEFVTLLQRIREEKIDPHNVANDPDVIFSSTVGWWYNEKRNGVTNGYLPSGATELTTYLDYVVPMVYSGGVGETAADIISRVDDEIQIAQAPTVIGISIESLRDFAGVYSATNELTEAFENDAAFLGVSVFQFDTLAATPPICPTTIVSDDLLDWVGDNIIRTLGDPDHQKTMPRDSTFEGDDYDEPTPAQLILWNDMLVKLFSNNITEACAMANQLGYELIDFEERPDQKYYVLKTVPYHAITNLNPHFWGTYILNRNPRMSNLIIQSPHPLKDTNTGRQGVEVLRQTGALFFMMAGTSRCNLECNTLAGDTPGTNCSSCVGSTSVCHTGSESYLYPLSDMAHNEGSVFHKTTEALSTLPCYFIQLHGFEWESGDPHAVISNGTSQTPANYDPLPVLGKMLKIKCELLNEQEDPICVVHEDLPASGTTCYQLRGFSNTQGRMLNGDDTPCQDEESLTPSAKFVHLEQRYENFRQFRADYGKVAQAIANTFDEEKFEVSTISNTSGLLTPENFEPEPYSYNFIAPLQSELLCKNNHLGTVPVTDVIDIVPSTTYEDNEDDETGELTSSSIIANTERIWFLAKTSITLTEGFEVTSDDFFSAELKNELDFCETPSNYTPSSFENRLFTSIYGPRMTSSGGDITRPYDYHRGEDMVDKKFPTGPDMPNIICMCDGVIHEVFDETDAANLNPPCIDIETNNGTCPDEGRSVTVKCNAIFNGSGFGNIYTAYRHLSVIEPGLTEGVTIRKGDLIGKMGSSGSPSLSGGHLHFSVQKMVGGNLINVHPMRVFNLAINKHLNLAIDEPPLSNDEEEMKKEQVNMFLLDHNNGSETIEDNYASFRIAVPYNKTAIRAVIVRHGETYEETADFEKISQERDGNAAWLDDPDVGQLTLFPLPFVRAGSSSFSAYGRYNSIKNDLCNMDDDDVCDHPAINFPVLDEGVFTTPAYVLDIKAKGLDQFFNPSDFVIDVLDIWGNGVRGTMTPPSNPLFEAPPPSMTLTVAGSQNQQLKQTILSKATLSEKGNDQLEFNIYPNPTSQDEVFLEIKNGDVERGTLTIVNLSGRTVIRNTLPLSKGNQFRLNISSLVPGVYFVQLKTENQIQAVKFIRQ